MSVARMSKEDAIYAVQEAQEKINEAIEILADVARNMDDPHAEAYIVDQLKVIASSSHGFLDSSYNIDKWISDLNNGPEEDFSEYQPSIGMDEDDEE